MHATRAAVEEGVVPGGGVALIRCQPALDSIRVSDGGALRRQHRAARDRGAAPLHRQERGRRRARSSSTRCRSGKGAFGYNAHTEEYEDLLKAGIIDPTKVVRTALQNAASVAALCSRPKRWSPRSRRKTQGCPAACPAAWAACPA